MSDGLHLRSWGLALLCRLVALGFLLLVAGIVAYCVVT